MRPYDADRKRSEMIATDCGRVRRFVTVGAEGATAPETLRQKDRIGYALWKAGPNSGLTEGVSLGFEVKSLRFRDRGGELAAHIVYEGSLALARER